jgi:hypothetical protein
MLSKPSEVYVFVQATFGQVPEPLKWGACVLLTLLTTTAAAAAATTTG